MSPYQWSILAVFLGVCHSLVIESVIIKKIGISSIYSYSLRFFGGLFIAYVVALMPSYWFEATLINNVFTKTTYNTIEELLFGSVISAISLSIKIILLITILIFIMDYIKTRDYIIKSQKILVKAFHLQLVYF
jgi:hypothetical protein